MRGQVVVMFIVLLLPMAILLCIIAREGQSLLLNNKIQNFCDQRVLDGLAVQGKALQKLGGLNPTSRMLLKAQEKINLAMASGVATPAMLAAKRQIKTNLEMIQRLQDQIKMRSQTEVLRVFSQNHPRQYKQALITQWSPIIPQLYVEREHQYRNTRGAPLILSSDFDEKQKATGVIRFKTQEIVERFLLLPSSKDQHIECEAKIIMTNLEAPWKAQITKNSAVRPLWN